MLCQRSLMSPVVRQLLPIGGAHVAGWSWPHSHIENRIGRPVALSAALMGG